MPGTEPGPVRAKLYSVPIGTDFCDATASFILAQAREDTLSVGNTVLLLPNNRAIKAMTEAFVRTVKPGLLLPRMVAIGDLALDETLGPMLDPLDHLEPVLPAIGNAERLLLLAELVVRFSDYGQTPSAAEALRLARKLAELIDELEIEEVSITGFMQAAVDAELAGHWNGAYDRLRLILPEYEKQLEQRQVLGPATRRNILLRRLADRLSANAVDLQVIAAGITTSARAVAALLRQVASMSQGAVILPGLDIGMDIHQWEALGPHQKQESDLKPRRSHESHPQFHLKLLLYRMGFGRDEVDAIRVHQSEPSHIGNISDIFCLPVDTATWRDLPTVQKQFPHISMLEASDSAEEARAVAIKVRGALQQKEKRIAVITPDRELAIRVTAQLRRWDIPVDDSAGVPLLQTPQGTLIMALAQGVAARFAPVELLAIAKHPLVHAGDDRLPWLDKVRELDMLLRGPSEGIGLSMTAAKIGDDKSELNNWFRELSDGLEPLETAGKSSFEAMFDALQAVAGKLTGDAMWKGATGRQFAQLWDEFLACNLSSIGHVDRASLPALLSELFGTAVVRPPYGGHPRVAIYGLLEARMQQADLLICAGLNEGTWPQMVQPDPWLAPSIRRQLGLATLDRNIGLSAHDLLTALGARDVLLTRSKRDRSGPTIASRFVLRIKALVGDQLSYDSNTLALAAHIDRPNQRVSYAERPQPVPSSEQRNVNLSITDFDGLKSDPYSFYAKRILRLKSLEPVDAEPGYAWRGTLVHDVLEKWFHVDKCVPQKLLDRADALLRDEKLNPTLRALWQPRIADGLRWIAMETQRLQDEEGRRLLVAEVAGHMELLGVTIKGRADRIDGLLGEGLAIIDYKTGMPPKAKQINAGFALQLGLVGLMAEQGGIKGASGTATRFEYWSLAKNKERGFGYIAIPTSSKANDGKVDKSDFVAFARREAEEALALWIIGEAPFGAKLHPEYSNYDDYDQLMRLQEWNGRQHIIDGGTE